MANYKINRNKPEPTEEQINKNKDFQKLINNHQKVTQFKNATKPLYKNPGFLSFMVVLGVVLITFIITEKESVKNEKINSSTPIKTDTNTTNDLKSTSAISVPKVDTIINEESTTLKPQQEIEIVKQIDNRQTISIASGGCIYFGSTRVLIPPFAFSYTNGKAVNESVEIRYKEYRDPVDIALASIPMHYDTAQNQMQLISAGMFDIRGFVNNEPVVLSKSIQVEITSTNRKDYNLYYLNEKKNQWEYLSKENKLYRFSVIGDESNYRELLPFKALEWEFKPTDSKQLADFNLLFSKAWSQFILEEELQPDQPINVKFKRLSSEQSLKVTPVRLTSNTELNRQLLQAKYNLYKEGLKKKLRNEQLYREALQKQTAWLNSFEGKKYAEWLSSPEGQQQRLAMKVVSVFTINKFGVWNCDTPEEFPKEAKVIASFKDTQGNKLDLKEIKLVDYNKNSVYNYDKGQMIQFNPKSENILWSALPGGKLAVFTKENFKTIPKSGKATFVMNVIDIKGKSIDEVKALLAMNNHSTSKDKLKEKNSVANYERLVVLKPLDDKKDVFYSEDQVDINSNGIQDAKKKLPKW